MKGKIIILCLIGLVLLSGCNINFNATERQDNYEEACNNMNMTYIETVIVPTYEYECIDNLEVRTFIYEVAE